MPAKAKVTPQMVREIRESSERGKVLGARYGLSEAAISLVRRGRRWNDDAETAIVAVPEEELFQTAKKRAEVQPDRIAAIVARVGNSVFDLRRVA